MDCTTSPAHGLRSLRAHEFDGDGDADILWRHRDGAVVTWEVQGGAFVVNHNRRHW